LRHRAIGTGSAVEQPGLIVGFRGFAQPAPVVLDGLDRLGLGLDLFGGAGLLGFHWEPKPVRRWLSLLVVFADHERFAGSKVHHVKLYCDMAGQSEHAAIR
jgi:hypothetical protein